MKNILIIAGIVLVVGVIVTFYIRRREETYEGTVTDKDVQQQPIDNNMNNGNMLNNGGININMGNNNVQNVYSIKIKTTAGKTISRSISQGKYEIVKIGDHVSKQKGTTDIDIDSTAGTTRALDDTQPPAAITN